MAADEKRPPLFDFGTVLSFVILGIVSVQSLILVSYGRCLAAVGMFISECEEDWTHLRHSVGPDLSPNCLQRISADDTRSLRFFHFKTMCVS